MLFLQKEGCPFPSHSAVTGSASGSEGLPGCGREDLRVHSCWPGGTHWPLPHCCKPSGIGNALWQIHGRTAPLVAPRHRFRHLLYHFFPDQTDNLPLDLSTPCIHSMLSGPCCPFAQLHRIKPERIRVFHFPQSPWKPLLAFPVLACCQPLQELCLLFLRLQLPALSLAALLPCYIPFCYANSLITNSSFWDCNTPLLIL